MSQITTHILDTSKGKPAQGVEIQLEKQTQNGWEIISKGTTDDDGRIGDLLGVKQVLERGVYRMVFATGKYFARQKIESFYPEVVVIFNLFDASHYHVPLLLNPFGYSTYRGS